MKILSLALAILMTLTMTSSCGTPTSEVTEVKEEPIIEQEPAVVEEYNLYDSITNYFLDSPEELNIRLEKENPGNYFETWNDFEHEGSLRFSLYTSSMYGYGIISNEDYSRNAVLWIDILDPDREYVDKFLNDLDWHPENSYHSDDRPYGYIATEDSVLLVNATSYGEGFGLPTKTYEIFNVIAFADVMGINIEYAIGKCTSVEDALDIIYNLQQAAFLGTRGYSEYLDANFVGIITDRYEDIEYGLTNPYDGIYYDIYDIAYTDEFAFQNTDDYTEETPTEKYPPIVNQYIDYGYEVYKYEYCGAIGYYYRKGFMEYELFCIGNGDLVTDSFSKSVLQPTLMDDMFMTRIS